jgi:hypothetical protein
VQQGRFIGRGLVPGQGQPHETPHRYGIGRHFLRRQVGQVEPLLQQVQAQQRRQRIGRPAFAALGIVRFDHVRPCLPREKAISFGKELGAPGSQGAGRDASIVACVGCLFCLHGAPLIKPAGFALPGRVAYDRRPYPDETSRWQ